MRWWRAIDILPTGAQTIDAVRFGLGDLDTSTNETVRILTNADGSGTTGKVWNVKFLGTRLSSGGLNALKMQGAAAGDISAIRLAACEVVNHGQHGIVNLNAYDLGVADCDIWGNGASSPGKYAGAYLDGASKGNAFHSGRNGACQRFPSKTQSFGLLWGNGSDRNEVLGGDYSGNLNGAMNQTPPGANSKTGQSVVASAWP